MVGLPNQARGDIVNRADLPKGREVRRVPQFDLFILAGCRDKLTVGGHGNESHWCFMSKGREEHWTYRRLFHRKQFPNTYSFIRTRSKNSISRRIESNSVLFGFALAERIKSFAVLNPPYLDRFVGARACEDFSGGIEIQVVDGAVVPFQLPKQLAIKGVPNHNHAVITRCREQLTIRTQNPCVQGIFVAFDDSNYFGCVGG